MNLFSHTEPLEHLFDDGFRGVFAGQVAEGIQCVIHADRNGVQSKAAGGFGLDAVSVCVDDALDALCDLTGENASEAVIEQVFERFCVGK